MELACLHAHIEGRVQGVGFRYFVQDNANALGLTGWVRNVGEEQVEVWAEGSRESLEQLYLLLWQGPRSAHVQDVRVNWEKPKGGYLGFQIVSSTWFSL